MSPRMFEIQTSEGALRWMLSLNMIVRCPTMDPETFATTTGFLLSDEMRERIGCNLVRLLAKATGKRNKRLNGLTLRDAFLTATIAALLGSARTSFSEEELTRCANIVFALLPIGRLEEAELADTSLRAILGKRSLVEELQQLLGLDAISKRK